MKQRREEVHETRAETDTSLGVERAGDVEDARAAALAQRVMDDFIERDRLLADERLFKFRERADGLLARERLASPTRDKAIQLERRMADLDKQAERDITDGVLGRERERADLASGAERHDHGAEHLRQLQRREDTDSKLDTERSGADGVLDETAEALARVTDEQTRRADALAMVSHDLRSPLTVIALSAEFLVEEAPDAETGEVAQDIVRAAARMGRLLTDLLDVARIDSGTLAVVKGRHDIGELIMEVFRTYRPLFTNREMTLTVDAPTTPLPASIDHDRIVQVLSNLLGNSLKFTRPHGTVGLFVHQRAGAVEFELRDNGPGISADKLPHVFERFWQVQSDTRRGLGLGLYICEQIVAKHGGRIWAESVLGVGTTVRFTLPTAGADESAGMAAGG